METLEHVPATDRQLSADQLAQLDTGELVVIPASWDEFMAFLHQTQYRAEYHNGQLIITGLAAFYHEVLIGAVITLLNSLLKGKGFFVAGSNVGVLRQAPGQGYYNPDITVVKGKPEFTGKSTAIITNPYLVVEVLSVSTAGYDLYEKLPKYERITSLQEVIFIDRFDQSVTICRRTDTPNVWLRTFYETPGQLVQLAGDHLLPVSEFFADLPAEALGDQASQ